MSTAPCPICGKRIDLHGAPEAPFCSKRCRQLDLGRWLSEKYGLPVEPGEGEEVEPDEDSPSGENGNE